MPTPVDASKLDHELSGYQPHLKERLISGFKDGFPLGSERKAESRTCNNHNSALTNPTAVYEKLAKESLAGRIAGPFKKPPFKDLVCSPLGLVPKSDGKYRLIHDLSFPKGHSVNSDIPIENSAVSYDSIDHIIRLVKINGYGALMAKTDIENAFRIIPISPSDYNLLGFTWNNLFYYDKCLPMGASSSCNTFEALSTALVWIMQNKYQAGGMSHVLDDFFFIGPANSASCLRDLNNFIKLCDKIGIPLKQEKTVSPTNIITIYGIEVDSIQLECRLPQDKIAKIKEKLEAFSRKKKVTLRELQSLIGLLNFACSVVCPGRTFLRRLIDLTCGVVRPDFYIRLSPGAKADIAVWKAFIMQYNGKTVFYDDAWLSSDNLSLYTDASGSLACAAIFGTHWFVLPWPDDLKDHQIAVKELFPIVLALELWGLHMRNKKVLFLSDNIAVVHAINKMSCKDKTLMSLLRRLVSVALHYNIWFKSKHIFGKLNVTADFLSRLSLQKAFKESPWLDREPVLLPPHLLKI